MMGSKESAMPKNTMLLAAGLLLLAAGWYAAKRSAMIDPLKSSGLGDEEIRMYRYLQSLHEYSGVNIYDMPNDVSGIRAFNENCGARQCRVCGRIYADLDQTCPYFHGPTVLLSKAELRDTVNKWEAFRREYCKALGVKTLTRLWAIKLYWITKYPLEH
jgi:hypothetical protein